MLLAYVTMLTYFYNCKFVYIYIYIYIYIERERERERERDNNRQFYRELDQKEEGCDDDQPVAEESKQF